MREFGFEWIVLYIPKQCIEILFIGDIPRAVSHLPEMSCAFVFFIEVDGVVGIGLSHEQREVLSSSL
jgi:hypothetical protein